MKKTFKLLFTIATSVALVFSACKKEETTKKDNDAGITAPSSFTKKVLLEEFTGAWCGWCVDGHLRVEQMMAATPNRIIPVMVHSGDGMEPAEYRGYYQGTFSVSGFPTGMVNRVAGTDGKPVQSRSVWQNMATSEMAKTAKCGLTIDAKNVSGDAVTVKVSVGYADDVTVPQNLVIALLEDKVTGTGAAFDQKNFYSNNSQYQSHPFYSKPATIVGYEHKFVLRKFAKVPFTGEVIPADKTKKGAVYSSEEAMVTMDGLKKENCYIAAWVHTPGGVVENAQIVKVGELKSFD
jgi:hypothetical protein